jgi:hypothetical protein
MLAIVYDHSIPSDGSPSKQPEHAKLEQEMREKGHYVSGGGLAPVGMFVKSVKHEGGQAVVTDGPFAETREVLGGYYVVECSETEAVEWAKRIPVDNRSHVQVRVLGIYRPLEPA